jgi:hypothetical protein
MGELDWIYNNLDFNINSFIEGDRYIFKHGCTFETSVFQGRVTRKDFYMFKFGGDGVGDGSHYISEDYLNRLLTNNQVFAYVNNFNIDKFVNVSNNFSDVLKGSFIIFFKKPVFIDETKRIQELLFDLGFMFHSMDKRTILTNKEVKHPIYTLESINWNTSFDDYKGLPNMWDQKKMNVGPVYSDVFGENYVKEKVFCVAYDNNSTVINGDILLKKIK